MPRQSRGARLYLKAERERRRQRHTRRRLGNPRRWTQESTGCAQNDVAGAEAALERYLNRKHQAAARKPERDHAAIAIADVLALYAEHVAPNTARPKETLQMLERLAGFFGDKTLADINGELCRGFVRKRKTKSGAQPRLERVARGDQFPSRGGALRSCRKRHAAGERAGARSLVDAERGRSSDLARLALSRGAERTSTGRRSRQHVARFILVALYRARAPAPSAAQHSSTSPAQAISTSSAGSFTDGPRAPSKRKNGSPRFPLAPPTFGASATLATAGTTLLRRMERGADRRRRQGISAQRRRGQLTECHAAHAAPHGGDLVDAKEHGSMGSRRLSWHERRATRAHLWTPSPQSLERARATLSIADPAPNENKRPPHPSRTRNNGTERDFWCANVDENRAKSTPIV